MHDGSETLGAVRACSGPVSTSPPQCYLRRARIQIDGGKPISKGPKSAASPPVVDFDAEMVDMLRRWKVAQLEERLRAGTAWEPSEWLFTNQLAQPVNPEWVGKRFRRLIADTDLPTITMRPDAVTKTSGRGKNVILRQASDCAGDADETCDS